MLDSCGHISPEVDGLRIITNTGHEFLQKVPSANQEIFRIGSMAPGAILLEVCFLYLHINLTFIIYSFEFSMLN